MNPLGDRVASRQEQDGCASVDQSELAKQFKAKDQAKAKAAFDKANKSCSGCHEQYRDN